MNRQTKNLFKKKNVVSVGIGRKIVGGKDTGRQAVVVGVTKKVPLSELAPKDVIPKTIKGRETDVIQVGEIKALSDEEIDRKGRFRPAPGGISVGHKDISAGTLGCWVLKDDRWLILSNNHVLANVNEGKIGDAILQPGVYDSGTLPEDRIGWLAEFVEIEVGSTPPPPPPPPPNGCPIGRAIATVANFFASIVGSRTRLVPYREPGENLVDCALAAPDDNADVDRQILGIGAPVRSAEPELGLKVKKSGRTTAVTEGEIIQIEATVRVDMGGGRIAIFVDQFMVGGEFSAPGDSGSIILNERNNAVGLLFAGGEGITVGNRFSNVAEALNIAI